MKCCECKNYKRESNPRSRSGYCTLMPKETVFEGMTFNRPLIGVGQKSENINCPLNNK